MTFTIDWDSESLQVTCSCGDQVFLIEDDDTRDHATDNAVPLDTVCRAVAQHALDRHGDYYWSWS